MISETDYGSVILSNAEVGDKVMLRHGYDGSEYRPLVITKVTKTQIVTSDNRRWMKSSARLVGSDNWGRLSLRAFDEEKIEAAHLEMKRLVLARNLQNTKFGKFSLSVLAEIDAIIKRENGKGVEG